MNDSQVSGFGGWGGSNTFIMPEVIIGENDLRGAVPFVTCLIWDV